MFAGLDKDDVQGPDVGGWHVRSYDCATSRRPKIGPPGPGLALVSKGPSGTRRCPISLRDVYPEGSIERRKAYPPRREGTVTRSSVCTRTAAMARPIAIRSPTKQEKMEFTERIS